MNNVAASTQTSRIIQATAKDLYDAFLDPAALLDWLPPGDMTGKLHSFDARVGGGGYRISLFYPAESDKPHPDGKTSAQEDMVDVRFLEFDLPHRIVEAIRFVTDDPALQ